MAGAGAGDEQEQGCMAAHSCYTLAAVVPDVQNSEVFGALEVVVVVAAAVYWHAFHIVAQELVSG